MASSRYTGICAANLSNVVSAVTRHIRSALSPGAIYRRDRRGPRAGWQRPGMGIRDSNNVAPALRISSRKPGGHRQFAERCLIATSDAGDGNRAIGGGDPFAQRVSGALPEHHSARACRAIDSYRRPSSGISSFRRGRVDVACVFSRLIRRAKAQTPRACSAKSIRSVPETEMAFFNILMHDAPIVPSHSSWLG